MITLEEAIEAAKEELRDAVKDEVRAMFVGFTQNLDAQTLEDRFKTGVRAARHAELLAETLLPGCFSEKL